MNLNKHLCDNGKGFTDPGDVQKFLKVNQMRYENLIVSGVLLIRF